MADDEQRPSALISSGKTESGTEIIELSTQILGHPDAPERTQSMMDGSSRWSTPPASQASQSARLSGTAAPPHRTSGHEGRTVSVSHTQQLSRGRAHTNKTKAPSAVSFLPSFITSALAPVIGGVDPNPNGYTLLPSSSSEIKGWLSKQRAGGASGI